MSELINYNPVLIQRKIGVSESFESKCTVASMEFRTHWTFHWHNFIKMRYWRQFRDSLGETSVMITYIMIDYNDNKA
jgi:hypothetical protein